MSEIRETEPTLPIVERRFSETSPPPEHDLRPKPLSFFFARPAFVLLGDPGAGKTTSFQQASGEEPNAVYTTVRDFVTLGIDRYRGRTLYLDALDEMRGGTEDGRTVLDQVRSRLDELGCPRFRLSCRSADWYGSSDFNRLRKVSSDSTLTVLEIGPLGETEISRIVSSRDLEPASFLEEARSHGVSELLKNPQTLQMVLAVVEGGTWPRTRSELFDKATGILVRESNEEHLRHPRAAITEEVLLQAAGRLSAIVLCSGAEGLTLNPADDCEGFLPAQRMGIGVEAFCETLRRRLFRAQGAERVVPVHRTVAEYLAARFLRDTIHKGLPLKRILALISGPDGGPLTDLRGVLAWMTCLCPSHAGNLIPIDPLGSVLYGDVSLLPPSGRERIVHRLVSLAQNNPLSLAENWNPKPFGALACPEMEPTFREILSDQDQPQEAVDCVIHAVGHGIPLPSLGDPLLDIARDGTRHDFIRVHALDAFVRICPGSTEALRNLLDDIHEERVSDCNCELRANLLRRLYPSALGPAEVVRYLVDDPERTLGGEYTTWVGYQLMPATDPADVPVLLDALAQGGVAAGRRPRISWRSLVGQLLVDGLSRYGEDVDARRLYAWLGLGLDRHRRSRLEKEHADAVRAWLEHHPERVREIIEVWLSVTDPVDIRDEGYWLGGRLLRIDWPEGFGQWFIRKAANERDDRVAFFLFREAVRLRTRQVRSVSPTMEELWDFVRENNRFEDALRAELVCEIPIRQGKDEIQKTMRRIGQKTESARETNVQSLVSRLDRVCAGLDTGALFFLARAHFGLFVEVNRELCPRDRIASITNDECADAAQQGFVAALTQHADAPTAKMIIEAHADSRGYRFGWTVLAGMDVLSDRSMDELLRLPDSVLESAIAYHYSMGTGADQPWVRTLLRERVDLSVGVLGSLWRAGLARKRDDISGLRALACEEHMEEPARRLALPLLREFPSCAATHLECLLNAALLHSDREEFLDLARASLGRASPVRGDQRILWYAAAFLLTPVEFADPVRTYIGADAGKSGRFLSFVCGKRPAHERLRSSSLSPPAIASLVSICGPALVPRLMDEEDDTWGGPADHVRTIKWLIDQLGANPREDAAQALHALRLEGALVPWKDALAYASSVQAGKRREEAFRYPSSEEVVATLDGGPPANPADLQALVLQHLQALGDDIRDGSTDGYRVFWNVDPRRGRLITPKPEETCRDHLLDRLRERLNPLGLAAEPEGHFARDKRADVKVTFGNTLVLPVEIKRHYHRDLWKAPFTQLEALYTRDPATGGRGIYLVFWFGLAPGRSVPGPPNGIHRPTTAKELEAELRTVIARKGRTTMEVLVVDCSGR